MVKNRSARRYTDNYYQGVCCLAHTPPLLCASPAPLRMTRNVTGDTTSRVTTEARGAGLHRAHPMHHVHQCTTFTTRRNLETE